MILLHDVLNLIEVFFGEFVTVLENTSYFVVYAIERVKILLLEMPLFSLVGQQRYFVSNLFVIFD